MNPIGKIAKEIGEEVAEKITKEPLKWGFKGRKPTDIKDLDYVDLENRINMGYRDMKNQRIINNEYNKLIKGSEKNKRLKKYVDNDMYQYYNLFEPYKQIKQINSVKNKIIKLDAANTQFKLLENIGVPRELTGKVSQNKLMLKELNKLDDIDPGNLLLSDDAYPDILKEYNKKKNKWKKSLLRYNNELDDKQKETFDALSDEWEGSIDELIDVAKSL